MTDPTPLHTDDVPLAPMDGSPDETVPTEDMPEDADSAAHPS